MARGTIAGDGEEATAEGSRRENSLDPLCFLAIKVYRAHGSCGLFEGNLHYG